MTQVRVSVDLFFDVDDERDIEQQRAAVVGLVREIALNDVLSSTIETSLEVMDFANEIYAHIDFATAKYKESEVLS